MSFDLCPFVQSNVITLNHKGVDHRIKSIDLQDPPAWFTAISPTGKVPLLRVSDGETEEVIFESAVINEFIDEVSGGGMMPEDPVQRALHRAWIQFVGDLLLDAHRLGLAKTGDEFDAIHKGLLERLDRLEAGFTGGPFWNGFDLCLVDTAVAPLWMRLDALEEFGMVLLDADRFPRLAAYAEALLLRPEVYDSVCEDFEERHREHLLRSDGYLSHRILVA